MSRSRRKGGRRHGQKEKRRDDSYCSGFNFSGASLGGRKPRNVAVRHASTNNLLHRYTTTCPQQQKLFLFESSGLIEVNSMTLCAPAIENQAGFPHCGFNSAAPYAVWITDWGTLRDHPQVLSSFSASMLRHISDDEHAPNVEGKFASPQLWSQAAEFKLGQYSIRLFELIPRFWRWKRFESVLLLHTDQPS
jgi:hypothetical protein